LETDFEFGTKTATRELSIITVLATLEYTVKSKV